MNITPSMIHVEHTGKPCTEPLWQDVLSNPQDYTPAQIKAIYEANKRRKEKDKLINGRITKHNKTP